MRDPIRQLIEEQQAVRRLCGVCRKPKAECLAELARRAAWSEAEMREAWGR